MSASLNKKYSWEKKKKEQTPHQHQTPRPEDDTTHLFANFDRIPSPTRQEHLIARLDGRRHHLPRVIARAGAYGDHGSFRERCGRGRRGQEDPRCCFLFYNTPKVRFLLQTV